MDTLTPTDANRDPGGLAGPLSIRMLVLAGVWDPAANWLSAAMFECVECEHGNTNLAQFKPQQFPLILYQRKQNWKRERKGTATETQKWENPLL